MFNFSNKNTEKILEGIREPLWKGPVKKEENREEIEFSMKLDGKEEKKKGHEYCKFGNCDGGSIFIGSYCTHVCQCDCHKL